MATSSPGVGRGFFFINAKTHEEGNAGAPGGAARASSPGLTRRSITLQKMPLMLSSAARTMDCRVKPGNDEVLN
jgi:hypothetical protein